MGPMGDRELLDLMKAAEKEDKAMNALNQQFNLPFTGVGSMHKGPDFYATQIGNDAYRVNVNSSDPFSLSPQMMPDGRIQMSHGLSSGQEHVVDAPTMRKIIDMEHLPEFGLYRMTDEEKEELEEMKTMMAKWKRREQLSKFKNLPTHLRQEIVDEAIIKEKAVDIVREIPDTAYPDYERFQELKQKQGLHNNIFGGLHMDTIRPNYNHSGFVFKYAPIINEFSSDELQEAHSEASLEEELSD